MDTTTRVARAAGLLLACVLGCSEPSKPLSCAVDGDCPSGGSCDAGLCVVTSEPVDPQPGPTTATDGQSGGLSPGTVDLVPTSPVITNAAVSFRATVTGPVPDLVEILKDGAVIQQVGAPYQVALDTRSDAEGVHQLIARATWGVERRESAPVLITVDRTPPAVFAQTPAPGDDNAAVSAPITLTFSEPVELAVSDADAVVDLAADDSVAIAKRLVLSPDGSTLRVEPLGQLQPRAYLARLKVGLVDRAGNALAPTEWRWVMPFWRELAELSEAGASADFQLSIDVSGNPVLGMTELREGVPTAVVRRWSAAGWIAVGSALNKFDQQSATAPTAWFDSMGTLSVGWIERTLPDTAGFFSYHAYAARWDGERWAGIGGSLAPYSVNVHGGVDWTAGTPPWALSVETRNGRFGRLVARRFDGSGWVDQGDVINGVGRDAGSYSLAVAPAGAYAAWAQEAGIEYLAQRLYVSGNTSGAWATIGDALNAEADSRIRGARIAIPREGEMLLAWAERKSAGWKGWWRLNRYGSWSSPAELPEIEFVWDLECNTRAECFVPQVRGDAVRLLRKGSDEASWSPFGPELTGSRPATQQIAIGKNDDVAIAWGEYRSATMTTAIRVFVMNR